jgi:UDP-glucose 4-epimerase
MGNLHVIPQIFEKAIKSKESGGVFEIEGAGTQTRSFCHIDDFIDGVILLQDCGKNINVYNIGTEEELRIIDLARLMAELYSQDIKIIPGELMAGSVLRRCPDLNKIKSLGYQPKVSIEKGLAITVDWYKKNMSFAPNFS